MSHLREKVLGVRNYTVSQMNLRKIMWKQLA
jgi:hypothetical protein